MKFKKIFIIFIPTIVVVSIVGVYLFLNNKPTSNIKKDNNVIKNKKETKKEEKCTPIDGGSFSLILNTNGGEQISNMSVCIACSPDSYENIPTPKRDGFNFDGWYYDKEFKNKISFTNTKDFKAVQEKDKKGCVIGYKNIEIFAKWNEIPKEEPKQETIQSTEEVTNNQPVEETKPFETPTETPSSPTTRIYKPTKTGYVSRGYGANNNTFYNYITLYNMGGAYSYLYPINDAEVVSWSFTGNKSYRYILYKTKIDDEDYFVLYFTYSNLKPVRDFYSDPHANRNFSYDEPIVYLTSDNDVDNPNIYRVMISKVFSNDYKNVSRLLLQRSHGYSGLPVVNPALILELNPGDTYGGR